MLNTIIFIGAIYRWLFGITANREYVMEQCQVKYDKQCPAIENVIRTDGYYRSDERHSSIIFYPEGTFGSAVASWKNPTTEMLIPEYGMYSVSKDSILVNTILALELHRYWHLYEYKFHVLNCDSIELVSEKFYSVTRPKREKDPTPRVKITAGRDIYHFIPFNNLPDPDSPWKKMKGFWKNENDWADWMKDKSTHK